jgi:hypothetical protein
VSPSAAFQSRGLRPTVLTRRSQPTGSQEHEPERERGRSCDFAKCDLDGHELVDAGLNMGRPLGGATLSPRATSYMSTRRNFLESSSAELVGAFLLKGITWPFAQTPGGIHKFVVPLQDLEPNGIRPPKRYNAAFWLYSRLKFRSLRKASLRSVRSALLNRRQATFSPNSSIMPCKWAAARSTSTCLYCPARLSAERTAQR